MVIKEAEIRTLDVEKMERKGSYLPMFPLSEGGGGTITMQMKLMVQFVPPAALLPLFSLPTVYYFL